MKATCVAIALLFSVGQAATAAAPCRDGKGKFVACVPAVPKKCRDAKGKFTSCPAAPSAARAN